MAHQKKSGANASVYNYGIQNAPAQQDPPEEKEEKEYESLEEALLGEWKLVNFGLESTDSLPSSLW